MELFIVTYDLINALRKNKKELLNSIDKEEQNIRTIEEKKKRICSYLSEISKELEVALKKAQNTINLKLKRINISDCPVKTQYLVEYSQPNEFNTVKGDIEDITV